MAARDPFMADYLLEKKAEYGPALNGREWGVVNHYLDKVGKCHKGCDWKGKSKGKHDDKGNDTGKYKGKCKGQKGEGK